MRKLILVSNDDGISAKGVHELVKWLRPMGDVVVVCPDGARSGQSMAITFNAALRVSLVKEEEGVKWYKTTGTPVDCVKLSMHVVLGGRRPDLVVSGINHGSNAAINVVYSGTMGAAFEGCAFGIPSIGVSLTSHDPDADFSRCRPFVESLCKSVLEHGLPEGVCLNVNIPHQGDAPQRMQLCRACRGNWNDEYEEYTDPNGGKFYWLKGQFVNDEPLSTDTDEYALAHGIVSVVPTMLDRTAPLTTLPSWLRTL